MGVGQVTGEEGGAPPLISGYSYGNFIGTGYSPGDFVPNGYELAVPLDLASDVALNRIAVVVSEVGAAGSVLRLSIYEGSTGRPGALIVDAGTGAATALGLLARTLSLTVPSGRKFLAVAGQGAPATAPKVLGANADMLGPVPSIAGFSDFTPSGAWLRTGRTGASADWDAWALWPFQPRIQVRVA